MSISANNALSSLIDSWVHLKLGVTDKGKSVERRGHKATGLRDRTSYDSGAARNNEHAFLYVCSFADSRRSLQLSAEIE